MAKPCLLIMYPYRINTYLDMLCVAGDCNAHIGVVEPGDEESIGRFGLGTRNREGRELVEMLRRNGLVVTGTFFQKESHNITY